METLPKLTGELASKIALRKVNYTDDNLTVLGRSRLAHAAQIITQIFIAFIHKIPKRYNSSNRDYATYPIPYFSKCS